MDTPALGGPLARHPRVVDALVVGPLLLLGVLPATLAAVGPEVDGPGVPAGLVLVVTLLQVVPLWWRRTRPEVAAAVVVLAHLAQLPLTDGPLPSNVAAPFAAYAVAAWSGSRPARLAVLVVCVLSGGLGVADWWDPELSAVPQVINAIFFSAVASLCWAWGDLTRRRRELLQRLREQNLALRRDRDQRLRIAAQDERTRIATPWRPWGFRSRWPRLGTAPGRPARAPGRRSSANSTRGRWCRTPWPPGGSWARTGWMCAPGSSTPSSCPPALT